MRASLFQLAILNATRKPTRTLLTAGIVVVATAMLLVSVSWLDGVFVDMLDDATNAIGHVRVVDPDFAEREQLMPLYENIEDAQAVVDALLAHEDVLEAYPKVMTGVTVSVGEEIGDVFGLVLGAPVEFLNKRIGVEENLVQGRMFHEDAEEVVMGARVAGQAGAELGDEVVMLGMTQDGSLSPIKGELVGIAQAGNPLIDQQIFVPLERARWLVDIEGGAIEVLAFGDDFDDAAELAASVAGIDSLSAYRVQAWSERPPFNSMMGMVDGIYFFLLFVIVFLAALGIWNTMMMSVMERTDEIGVLRAMGMTRLGAVGLFVVEAVAIAVLGGLVGIALGAFPSYLLTVNGLELGEQLTSRIGSDLPISSHVYGLLSIKGVLLSFGMALSMAVLGSAIPSVRAAMIQPVTAMRSGR
jgi:putative ABC transport system permease protein